MPHLVILYTPNLDAGMGALCRALADTLLAVRDEAGAQVFPTGGTRVLAFPAAHHAVADGAAEYGFVYMNLRIGAGRSDATKTRAGQAILERSRAHFAQMFERIPAGLTVQVDEAPGQAYDGKFSTLHPLFNG